MKKNKTLISFLSFAAIILYTLLSNDEITIEKQENKKTDSNNTNVVKVEYIDVGQADAILIENNKKYMLIDAGNNEDGDLLVNYFKDKNITDFEYVVATHPHEDHIGGMDNIIKNFNIKNYYMPDCYTTTKTFEELLDALEEKNLSFETPDIDSEFLLGDALFKVLYTGTDKRDLNNTSIVLRMTYKDVSFMFTGDATNTTEKKILAKDLQSDVLKVGHHGSQYSTSDEFLDKVNPKYAIISVGTGNVYDHPKDITLNKLKGIEVHRTDKEGTIRVISDGKNIDIETFKTNTNG
ncbi:MAG: ComEC/Rec2 family competence protein [Bacilli bacterium]|nr:ComEC/Rec2 family competence protein [Bacilli bacterium]